LKRTPRGRETTAHAWTHLGLEPPAERNLNNKVDPASGTTPGQGELL